MAPWIILDDVAVASTSTLSWTDTNYDSISSFYNGTTSTWTGESGSDSQYLEWRFRGREMSIYGTHSSDFAYQYGLVDRGFGREGDSQGPGSTKKEAQDKVNTYLLAQYALDEETEHIARLIPQRGTFSLDYVLYKPVDRAPLAGLTVLVDDADIGPLEGGESWSRKSLSGRLVATGVDGGSQNSTGASESPAGSVGKPMLDGISETNAVGASFEYVFNGSSIALYGAFHHVAGTLRVEYAIDDQVFSTTHFNGSQRVEPSRWALNQALFMRSLGDDFPAPDASKPDEHTLRVRVEEASGDQSLMVDYLTYTATESTIVRIPAVESFEIDRTMNPGPVVAGAVAVVLLWLYIFLGDKLRCGSKTKSHTAGTAEEVDPTAKPPSTV